MKVTDTEPHPDAQLVRYSANFAVWDRFTAVVEPDGPQQPVCRITVVMENGRAVCEELQARRRAGGAPITGTVLRGISLDAYVRHAVGAAARLIVPAAVLKDLAAHVHAVPIDDGEWVAIPSGGLELSNYFHAEHPKAQRREHGARVTDDELRKVAGVYRAAHAARKPPTAEVAKELHVSRSTAGRYVQRAREKGFLGPTRPRVAGEQDL